MAYQDPAGNRIFSPKNASGILLEINKMLHRGISRFT